MRILGRGHRDAKRSRSWSAGDPVRGGDLGTVVDDDDDLAGISDRLVCAPEELRS